MKKTRHRKDDHLRICLTKAVEAGCPGFHRFLLEHRGLPEQSLADIDCSTSFLGKRLAIPLVIEAITGGTSQGKQINRDLAAAAAEYGIAMGVGSQRAAIEDEKVAETFRVRDVAPDTFLIANLGAVQLNYGYGIEECQRAVDMIGADALALHINPVQEAVQPEGDTNFTCLTKAINHVAKKLKVPVIAKGVGAGISYETAKRLKVAAFDVGGVGGTSWPLVESFRADERGKRLGELYAGWGIPTADNIVELAPLKKPLIASGGVRSGLDGAKALGLGAAVCGMALPFLLAWKKGGRKGVTTFLDAFLAELKVAMFLSGAVSVKELEGRIH